MELPSFVIKRNQTQEKFQTQKIEESIWTAARNVGGQDKNLAHRLATEAIEYLKTVYKNRKEIHTSDIASAVEKVLVTNGHYITVKEYILSREHKRQEFQKFRELGVSDDIGKLSYNALFILKERYLWKDENGKTIETPKGMLNRVAKAVAKAEKTKALQKKWEKEFYDLMMSWEFLPGTRVLANAGKERQQMANCFVFDIEDSIDSIFKTLYESSITKKNGGGCGYNFSKIRPKGDLVAGEAGLACGPVQIMQMFDLPTSIFRQQGRYESGNMAILNADHPDIFEFITAKDKDGVLPKTNISIGITNKFMKAVKNDADWDLINPRTGEVVNTVKAKSILELAATYAHKTGDPGMIFLDEINDDNPTNKGLGPIMATNPCGEEPLYPYESCNLGYLNLPIFLETDKKGKKKYNFDRLEKAARLATRFMDDVIDVSWFPVPEQNDTIKKKFRRIGIGIVGWADLLVDMEMSYNDPESLKLAEKIMKTIAFGCHDESMYLGAEKGPFENVKYSIWANKKRQPRNIMTNTLPPSSGNAVIFGTSYSLEPFFALAYHQNILGGVRIQNVNEKLINMLKSEGIYVENLFERISENHGSIQHIKEIPERIRRLFLTAHDIHWKDHVKTQGAWQKYTDNAITKTINMSYDATVEDIKNAYILAWELGCKGITVYRDQTKQEQVFEFSDKKPADRKLRAGDNCPNCDEKLISSEGCIKCLSCSFSLCEI